MITAVTNGIKVSVVTNFIENHSNPDLGYFLFSYKIRIENTSEYAVQVLRRHWNIFDACYEKRVVDGEGVVGKQPVLAPGEVYEYESACDLRTEIGSMDGYYTVKRKVDNKQYDVEIPRFALIRPTRLN